MKSPEEPPGADPAVTITGGPKSTEADYTDMLTSAKLVDSGGSAARTLSADLARVVSALPATAAILSPVTAAHVAVEAVAVTLGPHGLVTLSLQLETLARGLRLSVRLYQAQDAAVAASMSAFHFATAPAHTAGVLAIVASGAAHQTMFDATLGVVRHPGRAPINPFSAFRQHFTTNLDTAARIDPAFTEDAIRSARIAAWAAFPAAGSSFESQVGSILAVSTRFGVLEDSTPVKVSPAGVTDVHPPPASSIGGLVTVEAQTESAGNKDRSRLTVDHRVDAQGRGHWVVNVPGTQAWGMGMPPNPSDATANLRSLAGRESSLYPAVTTAVTAAMRKAGVKPGSEPVMLVGHSQGGIVASRLASNAQFRTRFKVTHVLTVASPESRIKTPTSVQALSIEHRADPVPRLDTSTGPNTSNRTRAYLDPRSMMPGKGAIDQHTGQRYAETSTTHLGRNNTDPALRRWYSQTEGFMAGTDTRYAYNLSRPQPPPAAPPSPAPAPAPPPTSPPAWMTPRPWTAQTPRG